MRSSRPVRAVVFDFDGLVLDTEGPVYTAWAEVYESYGQHLPLDFWATTVIGRGQRFFDPVADLETRLGRRLDAGAVQLRRRAREMELVAALPVMPGVKEWRAEARMRGLKLGVASSSRRQWVAGHLTRLGLSEWDCVCCAEDAERVKPAPDLYRVAMARLGVPAAEALAIEDSASGVAAAKAAGLLCLAVPCALTAGHDLSAADLRLGSLRERSLGEVLASLGYSAPARVSQ